MLLVTVAIRLALVAPTRLIAYPWFDRDHLLLVDFFSRFFFIDARIFPVVCDDYLTPFCGLIRSVHKAGLHDNVLFDRHNAVLLQLLIEELEEFLHKPFIDQLKPKTA